MDEDPLGSGRRDAEGADRDEGPGLGVPSVEEDKYRSGTDRRLSADAVA